MRTFITNITIYTTMIFAIYLDEFENVEYAGNLAVFTAWFFIIAGFLLLFADPKDLFDKKTILPKVSKTYQYIMIAFMVSIGWTWTGLFYFVAALFMQIKHSTYKDTLNKAK